MSFETVADTIQTPEEYAHSLRAIVGLGHVAILEPTPDFEHGEVQEAWRDFVSATEENLATDAEYGDQLTFEPFRSYDMIDDRVVDGLGQPIADLVRRGYEASCQAALSDPEMSIQAERDSGDIAVVDIVDSLEVGELYAVVSMDPKTDLQRNPAYWRGKGYRLGMAVAQVYYRASEGEMLTGAYSIKRSSKAALRNIFAAYGVAVPLEESENRWIRHGIRLRTDREDAEEFGKGLIRAHRAEVGLTTASISVTELIGAREELVKACFNDYIVPLSRSYVTGYGEQKIQELAAAMLVAGSRYKPDEARMLGQLVEGQAPDDEAARFMEEKIRYALVEELRKSLPRYLSKNNQPAQSGVSMELAPDFGLFQAVQQRLPMDMSLRMAANIDDGRAAGRSYGGCTGAGSEKQDAASESGEFGAESQGAFGGKGESAGGSDKFGPLKFKCPKGHWNERPPAKTPKDFLTHCKTCRTSLKC